MEKQEFFTQDSLAKTPNTDSNGCPLATTLDGNSDIILDAGMAGDEVARIGGNLRLAKDGRTVLIPQPSDDPQDPLNWSWRKKHTMLFIVSLSAFLGDFGSGAGISTIVLQGAEWHRTPNQVNFAGNLNVAMVGVGGLIWIPFCYFWGRAPVLFWTTLSGTLFTIACTLAPNFPVFYSFRALMGVTLTACQMVGLCYIKDMFFFHEHARKIGLWAGLFLVGPYCGPFFGNFIISNTGKWQPIFWCVFGVGCLDLLLIILFADESWYRRDIPIDEQPERGSRFFRVIGIWQIRNHRTYFLSVWTSVRRLTAVFFKPVVIPAMAYYALSFMWAVGINITSSILLETPVAEGGYGFKTKSIAFIYFTPIIATILGELFGHWFNDYLANHYIASKKGHFKPEARLPTNYFAAILMIPGLILLGQALQRQLHWSIIVIGWGLYTFGVMIASVAITAYLLDCYQTGSGEVAGLLNFARTFGGFAVGYFQQPWGRKDGYGTSFGIQAAVVAAAVGILTVLWAWGHRMRARGGPLVL